ncbi:MAG: restriction endonuclease subunit S, partial [Chloroflexota bacterium]|nr:restriction endonuclease subunit S [Chloroflexota bacterium]
MKYVAPDSSSKLDGKPEDQIYLGLEDIESGTGCLLLDDTREEVESTVIDFAEGDILFGKLRPYLAKVVHADFDGVGSSELLVLRPKGGTCGRFLFYEILAEGFIDRVDSLTYGAKMPRASSEQVGNLLVGLPPVSEQQSIAAFLDRRTTKIDRLIRKQERLIELLEEKRSALISHAVTTGLDPDVPMKESGIGWLRGIPRHWEVVRLKFIARVQSGVAKGRNLDGEDTIDVPYLRVANVQQGFVDLSDVAAIRIRRGEMDRYLLKVGDILMTEGGDFDKLGRGTVWKGQIDPCIHQNHIFVVRASGGIGPRWITTITQADYARHYFILRSKQSTNL